jgi:hypothetical protein
MSMNEVKQLLLKKGIRDYATDFSDLIVYQPAPDAEVKLSFTCGARWNVLSAAELSLSFPSRDVDVAVGAYKNHLVDTYGPPVRSDAAPGNMDLCWGDCEKSDGWKLESRTTVTAGGRMQLMTRLSDQLLVRACDERRPAQIDRWLDSWISDMLQYTLGMILRSASAAYGRRYHEHLTVDVKTEQGTGENPLDSFVANEHEYFAGLDYDALYFEGAGPGTITLNFTGDQAGRKSQLNQRLYSASFTTTAFKNLHLAEGMQQKMKLFIKVLGKPTETNEQEGRISARWVDGTKEHQVTIEDSGRISFEQSDPGLKEAYRDAVDRYLADLSRKRYDQNPF